MTSFVFIHVPKCGGTSFRYLLNQSALNSGIQKSQIYIPGQNGVSNEKNIPQLNKKDLKSLSKKNIKVWGGHFKYGELKNKGLDIGDRPFHYTILRDPVQRFISHYNFFHYKLGYHDCKGISLNELTEERLVKYITLYSNIMVQYLSNVTHPKITGIENMYKIAFYNLLYEFGAYGVLELPQELFSTLQSRSPEWLKFKEYLPEKNQNPSESHVNESVLDIIAQKNKYDLLLYNKAKAMKINQISHQVKM